MPLLPLAVQQKQKTTRDGEQEKGSKNKNKWQSGSLTTSAMNGMRHYVTHIQSMREDAVNKNGW
jgi:hypothetical protein